MSGRVLFLDQFDQLGGAQRCLLNLLPAFAQAGYEMHLAVPGDGPFAAAARNPGASIHRIACGPYGSGKKSALDAVRFARDLPQQTSQIAALALKHEIDLIYVNGPRLMPSAAMASRGCPVVFHAHSVVTHGGAAQLTQWAIRSTSAHVIAACQFVLKPISPAIRHGRARVIYNGIAPVQCARRETRARHLQNNAAPWRLGVIGRIAPEKGQLELVRAARLIAGKHSVEFVICGDALFSGADYAERVRAEAQGLPVSFLGWRDDVREVLAGLDLLVVPSAATDATPLVILEAFSAGVPVLAFRSGGIPEIIQDGVTGVLCSPTAEHLAAALLGIMHLGGSALQTRAERARATFTQRFSLDRYRSEVMTVVDCAMCASRMAASCN